jgi:hypothetical protein
MLGYTRGCGVDLDSRENIKSHMAIQRKVQRGGNIPRYLRESPLWETTFKPILVRATRN